MKRSPVAVPLSLKIAQLIDSAGGSPHAELLVAFIKTILRTRTLAYGDVKLLHRTVRELRYAFSVYERYRHVRKITIFGSARTLATVPIYDLACAFTRRMTEAGFMVITGAGAGIMQAAQAGAGRQHSFGLNILLPFEQAANEIIQDDPKLVYLKYFFTRKLLFVKETNAFALFPGGFGTHDEAFEALTLMQTGKCDLMPVVFIDAPGSTYWLEWLDFIKRHMLQQGLISPADLHLFMITTDIDEAVYEITTFYRNYHSARYVDGQLIMRLQHPISEGLLTTLNRDFRDIVTRGEIVAGAPLGEDALEFPELPRLHLWFDRINYGRLRRLIDVVNQY